MTTHTCPPKKTAAQRFSRSASSRTPGGRSPAASVERGRRVPRGTRRTARPADHPHRRGHLGVRGRDRRAGTAAASGPPRRGHRHHRHRRQPARLPGAPTPRRCWCRSPAPATVPRAWRRRRWPTSSSTTSGISCSPATATASWAAHTPTAPNSLVVYMPERTNDSGFAMTSSLTSMLLACLMMLGRPGPRTPRRWRAPPSMSSACRPRHPRAGADQEAAHRLPRQRTAAGPRAGVGAQAAGTDCRRGGHVLRLAAGVPARAEVGARRRHPRRRVRLDRPVHPPLRPRHHRRAARAARARTPSR